MFLLGGTETYISLGIIGSNRNFSSIDHLEEEDLLINFLLAEKCLWYDNRCKPC